MARGNTPCGGLGGVASGGGRRLLLLAAFGCLAVAVRPRKIEEMTPGLEGAQEAQGCPTGVVNPPEDQRTYSSTWEGSACSYSRLDSPEDDREAWCAGEDDESPSVVMDLESDRTVVGVVTQGRKNGNQFVTKFAVQTSTDNKTWDSVRDEGFSVNRTSNDVALKVLTHFGREVKARYVKLILSAWVNHKSMRLGALVCEVCLQRTDDPKENRTYTSVFEGKEACKGSELSSSTTAWCAGEANDTKPQESVTLDLGRPKRVAGVATLGRNGGNQRVTGFVVKTRLNESSAWTSGSDFHVEKPEGDSPVESHFQQEVWARFVKVTPTKWEHWPSMRLGALICQACKVILDDPDDDNRNFSSLYPGEQCKGSRLSSTTTAWCAGTAADGASLTLDLLTVKRVVGVKTAGRPNTNQKVTGFYVSTSEDKASWKFRQPFLFSGNDSFIFPEVRARYVKVEPVKWEGWPSMRVAVQVCEA